MYLGRYWESSVLNKETKSLLPGADDTMQMTVLNQYWQILKTSVGKYGEWVLYTPMDADFCWSSPVLETHGSVIIQLQTFMPGSMHRLQVKKKTLPYLDYYFSFHPILFAPVYLTTHEIYSLLNIPKGNCEHYW